MEKARVGTRVVRGPDWSKEDEDGGEGHVGTVKVVNTTKTVDVLWDTGQCGKYSIGNDSKYELRVFDNASFGHKHTGIRCGGCQSVDCIGMIWACQECPGIYLCNSCYCGDKHYLRHRFKRLDDPGVDGVAVSKRSTSYKVRSTGLFLGAKVKRLHICEQKENDNERLGVVTEVLQDGQNEAERDAVKVTWSNNETSICRPGGDVICVEEMPGMFYYRDHLQLLYCGQEDVQDRNSKSSLNAEVENEGSLDHTDTSEVIDGEQCPCQQQVTRSVKNETDAERKTNFTPKVGDKVRVFKNVELVKTVLKEQWSDNIKDVLGKIGTITHIYTNRTLEVDFGNKAWVFLPECCEVVLEQTKDVPDKKSDSQGTASARNDNSESRLQSVVPEHGGEMLSKALERFCEEFPSAADVPTGLLVQAAASNNATLVLLIAIRCPHLVNAKHQYVTALMIACQRGHTDVAKVLLNANANVNIRNNKGATALIFALVNSHEQAALLLLQNGAEVNQKDILGKVALHYAAIKSSATVIKELFDRNADPNVQDESGDTPLNMSIIAGNVAAASQLIKCRKVNLQIRNKHGQTPVLLAAIQNDSQTIEAILQRCPVQKFPTITDGTIQAATYNSNVDAVRELIKMGADVNRTSEHHLLPVHDACLLGHFEIAKLLVKAGACVNKKDISGVTPLHLCVSPDAPFLTAENQTEVFATNLLLLKEMNARNNSPEKIQERSDLACFLVKHGASVKILDELGNTPMEVCTYQKMRDDLIRTVNLHRARGTDGINRFDCLFSRMPVPCVKCMNIMSDIRLIPCRHVVLCRNCGFSAIECPRCQYSIEERRDLDHKCVHH